MKIRKHGNGEYISDCGRFVIKNEYVWAVYVDGRKVRVFTYLEQAKEYCKNYK